MDLATLLGTELPLIQAPMAGVQDSALAIAVSEAGGLGSLPCAMLEPEKMDAEMARLSAGTQKPYNVNFFAHRFITIDAASHEQWRKTLAPYYTELGLDAKPASKAASRLPFNDAALACVRKHRPAVVSFHFGLPDDDLLGAVRATGARILSSATTLAEAMVLTERGVDAIIAQGLEAGGHRGHFLSDDLSRQSTTFKLVEEILATSSIPVIAAGGIAEPADVARAMALGAAGVQIGTAYLLADEARTSPVHRAALKSKQAHRTTLTTIFSGRPARGLVNRVITELGAMPDGVPPFPHAAPAWLALRAAAEAHDSGDFSPLWAGEKWQECRELDAARLTQWLASGFSEA